MGSSLITSHSNIGPSSFGNLRLITIPTVRYRFGKNDIITLDNDYDQVILHNVRYVSGATMISIDLAMILDGVVQEYERFTYNYDYNSGDTNAQYVYFERTISVTFSGRGLSNGYPRGCVGPIYIIVC